MSEVTQLSISLLLMKDMLYHYNNNLSSVNAVQKIDTFPVIWSSVQTLYDFVLVEPNPWQ